MKPTFEVWITRYELENNPIGDLARDILGDDNFPIKNNFLTIKKHLRSAGASDNALMAFDKAWYLYEK